MLRSRRGGTNRRSTFRRGNLRGLCGGILRWRITRHPSRGGSLPQSATLRRGNKGPLVPCHMEMEKWASGPCSKGGVEWEKDGGVRCEEGGDSCPFGVSADSCAVGAP